MTKLWDNVVMKKKHVLHQISSASLAALKSGSNKTWRYLNLFIQVIHYNNTGRKSARNSHSDDDV